MRMCLVKPQTKDGTIFIDSGAHDYDIKVREDKIGKDYQKEWLGKF